MHNVFSSYISRVLQYYTEEFVKGIVSEEIISAGPIHTITVDLQFCERRSPLS